MAHQRLLILCLIFGLAMNLPLLSQENIPTETKIEEGKEKVDDDPSGDPFFKAILEDEGTIWTAPVHFEGKHWLTLGAVALTTGILIHNDESIYRSFKDYQEKNSWVDWLSPKITVLGDGALNMGVAGLFFLGGLAFEDQKALDTGKLAVMSLIHVSIMVQVLKHLTGRQRPEIDGTDKWNGFSGAFKRYNERFALYDSFPSGHTITAWCTATVIAEMYRETLWVPVLCYSLASMVGLSRITEDAHWMSDVFVGAILGYAVSKFVVAKRKGHYENVHLVPVVGKDRYGIGIQVNF